MTDISVFQKKAPELLVDLAAQSAAILVEIAGFDTEKAELIGQEIALTMAKHWSGQLIYFPKGVFFRVSLRYLQIYEEFNGRNCAELAQKHEMSVPWIYRIIKRLRQEERDRAQPGLFDLSSQEEEENKHEVFNQD
jgi:Mor family transcriptional regulator